MASEDQEGAAEAEERLNLSSPSRVAARVVEARPATWRRSSSRASLFSGVMG
jgi:hypothetical protein